jgi:hypothetical protein
MTRTAQRLLTGVLLVLAVHTHAQTDTTHRKKPAIARPKPPIPNSTKLELVYREALVTHYNTNGGSSSYNVFVPYVRVNDAKPVEIGKHAEFLRQFFSRCNDADAQIDLMNQQLRRAKLDFWLGVGVGGTVFFSGLPAAANSSGSGSTAFFTHAAVGAAIITGGAWLAHWHAKRADEHLRLSVDLYNSRCFKPLPSDTAKWHRADTSKPASHNPVAASPMKLYQDTTLSKLLRNDPSHSGLFGLTVMPLLVDVYPLNLNARAGIGAFYTYESKFGVSVSYQQAYVDDLTGHHKDIPVGVDNFGDAAGYKKMTLLDLQTKMTTIAWEKEGYYHLHLGNTRIGGVRAEAIGRVKGTILRAITTRLGYQIDNRVVQSDNNGIAFATNTPAYNYHAADGSVGPLTPTNLITSGAMLHSGIITAGVGYSTFRDIKIQLLDDTYTGRRQEESQSDIYVDVLYAQSQKLGDMIYYLSVPDNYGHMPQRLDLSATPMKKIGWRLGFQTVSMWRPHFGIKTFAEIGMRPGPQTLVNEEKVYGLLGFALIFGGRITSAQ